MANTQQGFPQLSAPISDLSSGGRVTQPWLQFFISLWNRTGAQQGGATFFPGDLKAIAGSGIPTGWLLCDGSAVSRTVFSVLFASIGNTWGNGDGSTTFNIPDLRTRSPIGQDISFPLGSVGGSTSINLITDNLPSHNHAIIDPGHDHTITDPGHFHTSIVPASNGTSGAAAVGRTSGNTGTSTTGITVNTNTTGITTADTGSGTPVKTISPYAVVQWIIKT